ncbi:hypothetical protein Tco_0884489 [Tanacetum coccineum]
MSEALKHPEWVDAMQEELYQFYKNKFLSKDTKGSPNNLGSDLASKPVNETLYRGMIGSLMYLKGTLSLGLYYPKCLGFDLKGYSDSNYASCNMDRKSTSGACQILRGKLVYWSAKKQQSVAMSSAEVEYVVVGCCANILWMKSQLNYYDIHYKMLADIFTKPLDEPTFTRLKAELANQAVDLHANLQVLNELLTEKGLYKSPLVLYQNFLREFWCMAITYNRNPPTDETKSCPLKEYLIEFLVMNGKKPLNLDFKTFTTSTSLDYNNGESVTEIELTAHMIAVNNQKDSMSPLPFSGKKKKVKDQTATPTLPKSHSPGIGYSLKDKNQIKTDKIEHGNEKRVQKLKSKSKTKMKGCNELDWRTRFLDGYDDALRLLTEVTQQAHVPA